MRMSNAMERRDLAGDDAFVVPELLSAEACDEWIRRTELIGDEIAPIS